MKPQDLRIGNLVTINQTALHFDGSGESDPIFEIGEIRTDLVYFKGFHTGEYCSSLQPIPLTEEWLLKLGFIPDRGMLFELPIHIQKKCKEDNGFKKSAFFFNKREDLNSWMDCQTRVCVKYVHQVQNLVYALTGEELEVQI